ncbi:MAG: FAD:protein FMN transferase [Deltaproteobacteria bacterium]
MNNSILNFQSACPFYINVLLLLFLLIIISFKPAFPVEEETVERAQYHMGTHAGVLIRGGTNDDADAAFSRIGELDGKLSDYKPDSEISKISRMAGIEPVRVSGDTRDVLEIALSVAEDTGGAFDPTIGALTIGVYRFGREDGPPPEDRDIEKARALVDYRMLKIDGDRVYLEKEGMMLDLGGIGKGFAVEEAVKVLKSRGVKKGIVSLSGDIKVFGNDIEIGIKNPEEEGIIASFRTGTDDLAISTSGGYERIIDPGGKAYHHLIVSETGKPGREFLSMTVVLRGNSALVDAYATSLYVMGKDKAFQFLKDHPEIGVFAVLQNGDVYYNEAFAGIVHSLNVP